MHTAFHIPVTRPNQRPRSDRQTRLKTLPSRNFVCGIMIGGGNNSNTQVRASWLNIHMPVGRPVESE